jgi:primosomal protein N'
MRVLKDPERPEYAGRFTCKKCKAILEYTQKDVKVTTHADYEYVVCPFCDTREEIGDDGGH